MRSLILLLAVASAWADGIWVDSNDEGKIRAAKAGWWLMARIAGWDGRK